MEETTLSHINLAEEHHSELVEGEGDIFRDYHYTPSDMLGSLNEVLHGVGGHAQLQRVTPQGLMIPATQAEIAMVDISSRLKTSADYIQMLSSSERLKWCACKREQGNKLFQCQRGHEALQVYLEALLGTASITGEDEHFTEAMREKCRVLANMAAVSLKMKDYTKAEALSTEALCVQPDCFKARCQRVLAKANLHRFDAAREDLDIAREQAQTAADQSTIQSLERQIKLSSRARKAQTAIDGARYRRALIKLREDSGGGLYGEDESKRGSKRAACRPSNVTGAEAISVDNTAAAAYQASGLSSSPWLGGQSRWMWCWLAGLLLLSHVVFGQKE